MLALLSRVDLAGERSRVVIESAIAVMFELDRHYSGGPAAPKLRALVKKLLEPQRKRLGTPQAGAKETDQLRLLRAAVLAALFDLADDAAVAQQLEPLAVAYLKDPASVARTSAAGVRVSARAGGAGATQLDAARVVRARTPDERVARCGAVLPTRPDRAPRGVELIVSGEIRAGDYRHVRAGALARRYTAACFHAFVR